MSMYYTYIFNTTHYVSLPYYFKHCFSRKFECSNVVLGHKVITIVIFRLSYWSKHWPISYDSYQYALWLLQVLWRSWSNNWNKGIYHARTPTPTHTHTHIFYIYNKRVFKYQNFLGNVYAVVSYTLPWNDKDLNCFVSKTLK